MSSTMALAAPDRNAVAPETALVAALPAWALLALGATATLLTGPRWGVAALAWLAPVPYLLYVRRAHSRRAWLTLLGVLVVAFPLQLLTIITPPIPAIAIVGFGLPAALGLFAALGATEVIRRRAGETVGLFSFASLVAVGDWLGYGTSELGAWSATANSQVGALPLLQLASLAGLAGIGFLMAWVAGLIALLLGAPQPTRRWPQVGVAGAVLLAVLQFGSARLDATHGGRTARVAAVATDLGLTPAGIPDAAALAANNDTLFQRTRLAAARGAQLVVWNEAATLVEPADEAALVARARAEARALKVDLVVAYGVLLGRAPLLIDNKYVFVTAEGEIAETYRKHHPVPGEPSLRGEEPLRVIERPYGRVAGAICYDYDFPALARQHAQLGAELVVVPSSDWRGIDPVHSLMSRVRAIEGGFSVVRAVRWGSSAGFDAYGRVRGWMPVTEDNDRVLVMNIPVGRVETLYGVIGDAPLAAAGGWLLIACVLARRRNPAATLARCPRRAAPTHH